MYVSFTCTDGRKVAVNPGHVRFVGEHPTAAGETRSSYVHFTDCDSLIVLGSMETTLQKLMRHAFVPETA